MSAPAATERAFADRFQPERLLKRGRWAETWLGRDTKDGSGVVIKTTPLSGVSTGAQMRLRHEAETLRHVRSPSLVPLLAMGQEDGVVYLVMPFVEGITLHTRLAEGRLEVPDALTVARGVLTALEEAHDHQVLHRDVKPANVIVDDATPLRRAVLIDFGLARSGLLDPSIRDHPVGTVRYISPEQAGLLNSEVDGRSDLYSAGILLFECLAGRPPFPGETAGEVLRQHLTSHAPDLRSLGLAVPRALDEVVQRLLRKDPRDRYQSAEAALADIEAIGDALERGVAEPRIAVGGRDVRRTLTEPAFVGREREVATLDELAERARGGQGGLVLVEAESGGGKTWLLEEMAQRCAQRGTWVLRGQGLDQAAQRPFQVLTGVAAGIAKAEHRVLHNVRKRLGDRCEAVASALPELAGPLDVDGTDALGPEAFGETRNLDALVALIGALGRRARPAVVLLDDCQWADELTFKLLARLRRDQPTHTLVVVAFRSEEVSPGHSLRQVEPLARLPLPRFGEHDMRQLVESMAGELPGEALETVVRLAAGNPFMASAVLRGMVESGALRDEPGGWRVDATALEDVRSSRQAAVFLTRRLELLPPEALQLLSVAAVLGKEFDLEMAADLAGQPPHRAYAVVQEARRRHIAWWADVDAKATFVHDKLRETLLDRLDDQDRRALHADAARLIEEHDATRVFELAYHFDAAGQTARALPHALAGAGQARERNALELAEEQYRIALRGVGNDDRELRLEVAEGLGDVLMLRGRYDEAAEQLEQARGLAQSAELAAAIDGKLGELYFKRGDMARAAAPLEDALRSVGGRVPRSAAGYVFWAVWEILVQLMHTVAPRLFVGRRPPGRASDDLLIAHLHSRLAHVYWFQRGKVPTLWTHLRGMNLAERYPPTPELAHAYSEHAPVMTVLPWFSRGIAYAQRSLAIRRSLNDLWGEGQSLHFYGIVLYSASRYEESIERLQEAVRLLERTGDRWELNTARWHIAFALYRLGRLDEAVQTAQAVHADGTGIGDPQAAGISLGAWSKAARGRIPANVVEAQLREASAEDAHTAAEILQAEAVRLLAADRPADAVARLEQARRMVRAKGLKQEYVAPIEPWLATALRQQAKQVPPWDRRRLARVQRRNRRVARRARRVARSYPNNAPHALRESALAHLAAGRRRHARRLLRRSAEVARAQGARHELATTQLLLGEIGLDLGWDGAAEDVAAAREALEAMGATATAAPVSGAPLPLGTEPVTLSLADRFDTVLDGGRKIASALTPDDIFRAVREGALTLLRGERCIVVGVERDAGQRITGVLDGDVNEPDDLCRSLGERALDGGRAVSFALEMPSDESTSDSVALAGIRSALCAPISVRGNPVACFYITHQEVSGLFGADEERLAEFIATIAGAALENAEGFAGVQALTRSLEKRVEERTGQLEETNRQLDVSLNKLQEAYDRERHATEQLKHQAFHDSLTSLANRALFTDRVDHALARARRRQERLAVLFLDLDDFKLVNDSLGHPVGDELLTLVADRLRESLRDSDTAARLGGDEFAVLLEDTSDPDEAAAAASRIMHALEVPFVLQGTEVFVHASLGIAMSSISDAAEHSGDLLRNADLAMYMAKDQGKQRHELFRPEMHTEVLDRLALKGDLQRVVENDELSVQYQPIFGIADGRMVGIEALVRWQHPERGLVAPGEFIGPAEETGLIVAIGDWVLRESCRAAAGIRLLADGPLALHVNLSARQLQEPGLVATVADALEQSGLGPENLVLEITESVLMHDPDATVGRLTELRALGVRLALDDFGTGYSSLSRLSRFPIDILKVDKSFVDSVDSEPAEAALTKAIIKLSETLGLQTIAEGIERPEQLAVLRDLGCGLGQGFLYAEPMDPAELAGRLESLHSGVAAATPEPA